MNKADPEAQVITCCDCGTNFIFGSGEQAFFRDRNLAPPKRCKACRQRRKEEKPESNRGDPLNRMTRIPH